MQAAPGSATAPEALLTAARILERDGRFDDAAAALVAGKGARATRFEPRPSAAVRIERSPSGDDRRAELAGGGSLRVGGARVVLPDLGFSLDDARRRGLAFALARAGELAAEPVALPALLDALEGELDGGALERWGEGRGDLARPPRIAIAETLRRLASARFELE